MLTDEYRRLPFLPSSLFGRITVPVLFIEHASIHSAQSSTKLISEVAPFNVIINKPQKPLKAYEV